jgi:5'-methylthioadenosine phosphorylase
VTREAAATQADVGVFGGSGFYEFVGDVTTIDVDTPYGAPAAPISIATVDGARVAFLPRHGSDHRFGPASIPYRANVWAMRELGVRALLAPCACGSLQPELHPGEFVVVDQLVDRTWGRPDSFHDVGPVFHVPFADPYDARLRAELVRAGAEVGVTTHDGGTLVVIQGPRFSTRAESAWFRSMGWSVVNMTGYPEAVLAAEAGIPFAAVALVTDYDAGLDGVEPVTQEQVFTFFEQNVAKVRELLLVGIPRVAIR